MTIQDDFYSDEGGNPFINLTPHELYSDSKFQVVADRHAAVEISYASSLKEAQEMKEQMTRPCVCGQTHGVEIRESGNFVPDSDS